MQARKAFTLIELLVVIVIMAILIALVVGVFGKAQSTGRRAGCASNLAQIGKAYINYTNSSNDELPFFVASDGQKWVRGLGNFMGIKNSGTDSEPTLLDCSQSKAFLSPMAAHSAKKKGLVTDVTRQISYGFNYTLNNKTSLAATPRRLSDFEFPTQTMLNALTPRDEAVKGWKLVSNYFDYNPNTAPVFNQTGIDSDYGVTALWMDGRAQYLKAGAVPKVSAIDQPNWSDPTDGNKEYAYSWGMFWQLALHDASRMP